MTTFLFYLWAPGISMYSLFFLFVSLVLRRIPAPSSTWIIWRKKAVFWRSPLLTVCFCLQNNFKSWACFCGRTHIYITFLKNSNLTTNVDLTENENYLGNGKVTFGCSAWFTMSYLFICIHNCYTCYAISYLEQSFTLNLQIFLGFHRVTKCQVVYWFGYFVCSVHTCEESKTLPRSSRRFYEKPNPQIKKTRFKAEYDRQRLTWVHLQIIECVDTLHKYLCLSLLTITMLEKSCCYSLSL